MPPLRHVAHYPPVLPAKPILSSGKLDLKRLKDIALEVAK
jgi:hypothetical protein